MRKLGFALMLLCALPLALAAAPAARKGKAKKTVSSAPRDYSNTLATLQTEAGDITIKFFHDKAPKHVENFIDLASKGFYDNTFFHRVIPGFMIQGGDPNTKGAEDAAHRYGTGGNVVGGKEAQLKAEFNDTSHKRGIVSMARSQNPNSASSQFFVVVKDSTFLDNQYTAFGEVVAGMDVVDKIVAAPKNANDLPNQPTRVKKIMLTQAKG